MVGRELGKNDPKIAKFTYICFTVVTPFVILTFMAICYFFQDGLLSTFSNIPSTIAEAKKAMLIFTFCMFPDIMKGTIRGVFRALGA